MTKRPRRLMNWLACPTLILAAEAQALAGIGGQSPRVVFSPNETHMLVLCEATYPEAYYAVQTLPNGSYLDLRDFPCSGVYEVNNKSPLWKVSWREGFHCLSDDGRYLARFNWKAFSYNPRRAWGLKFYDRGVELKSYDVDELVDFPSLLDFTTDDWRHIWMDPDWRTNNISICDNTLKFRTATRERYRFDVTTGEIIEEFRFWRLARRVVFLIAFPVFVLSVFFVSRQKKHAKHNPTIARKSFDVRRIGGVEWSFSVRSLIFLVTIIAMVLGVWRVSPRVAPLIACMAASLWLTSSALKTRQSGLRRQVLCTFTVASWLLVYIVSFAPALGALRSLGLPYDVQMVLLKFYAPINWLLDGLYKLDLAQWYFKAWQ